MRVWIGQANEALPQDFSRRSVFSLSGITRYFVEPEPRPRVGIGSLGIKRDTLHDGAFLLSELPPSPEQKRLAACMVVDFSVASAVTTPFALLPLANTEVLLPAYAAAVFVTRLITATLLMALFSVQRSRAVLVLAMAYLFSGLMIMPWVLTFPGVFPAFELNTNLQSTATVAALRRIAFPLLVIVYALLKVVETAQIRAADNPG